MTPASYFAIKICALVICALVMVSAGSSWAACTGSGASFRCDPIVSESLRRQYEGLPPRYAPSPLQRYQYEGRTYTTKHGASIHRYKYKTPSGRTYRGTVKELPGGVVSHRGRVDGGRHAR